MILEFKLKGKVNCWDGDLNSPNGITESIIEAMMASPHIWAFERPIFILLDKVGEDNRATLVAQLPEKMQFNWLQHCNQK